METCSSCGAALAANQVLYTADAKIVCADCQAKADLVDTDKRAARNIIKAGWAALGAGVLSMLGPLAMLGVITYLFIVAAALSAAFVVQSLARSAENDRFTKHLSQRQRMTAWVTCVAGVVLAAAAGMGYANQLALYVIHKT